MKKLILAIAAVALIASPALAVDWNFYGSARMATWYVSQDLGDGQTVPGGSDSDQELLWQWQQNSRIGAKVKAENISGQFELGLRASAMTGFGGATRGDNNQSNGSRAWSADEDVRNRRLYGVWDFGAGKLKVGKDYTPASQLLFGSVFDDDNGLVDSGAFFGGRPGQIALSFGGFEIAFIEPETNLINSTGGFVSGVDYDQVFPKVEAKFGMAMDMFSWNVRGGYQTFHVAGGGPVAGGNFDVESYVLAGDVVVNLGPFAITGAGSWGANWGNAGWTTPGLYTYGGYATFNGAGTDNTKDCDSYQFAGSVRFKFTDTMTFEVGAGYHNDDPDSNILDEDEVAQYYAQAVIALAPGVWIVPEIGYYDWYDTPLNTDEGNQFYAGLKWQIDF